MELVHYLNDGANYQAQQVLAYMRYYAYEVEDLGYAYKIGYHKFRIEVGRYENCREQGYVFTIRFRGRQRNWAVYQHRNSDSIIVLISNKDTINTPNIDDMWEDKGENPSKSDYDKAFAVGEVNECGEYILNDMRNFINDIKDETNE